MKVLEGELEGTEEGVRGHGRDNCSLLKGQIECTGGVVGGYKGTVEGHQKSSWKALKRQSEGRTGGTVGR